MRNSPEASSNMFAKASLPHPVWHAPFAQFKQWMTAIYQTLKGLGKPINDDIRQVFDGLLAEEPHRTVILPEAERGPTLADIHEADAELTHPKDAEAVGDRIVAERDRAIQDHEPETAKASQGKNSESTPKPPSLPAEGGAGAGGHDQVGVDSGEIRISAPKRHTRRGRRRGAARRRRQACREGAGWQALSPEEQEAQMSEQEMLARALGMPSLPSQLQSGSVPNPDLPTEPGTSS